MATQAQKQIKKAIEESSDVFADKIVCKKDGSVEIKRGYFYRHGATAQGWQEKVEQALIAANVDFDSGRCRDDWQAWPKDSYFVAVVHTEMKVVLK